MKTTKKGTLENFSETELQAWTDVLDCLLLLRKSQLKCQGCHLKFVFTIDYRPTEKLGEVAKLVCRDCIRLDDDTWLKQQKEK